MAIYSGTSGNDTLNGGGAADLLSGLAGNDVLYGNSGGDILIGGAGVDKVYGGAGDDTLQVGEGEVAAGEVYGGGSGNDTLLISILSPASSGFVAYFNNAVVSSIENLSFIGGGYTSAWFNADTIGPGLSSSLHVIGGSGVHDIELAIGTNTNIDLSGWTFGAFAGYITIDGGNGNDVVTGSAVDDVFDLGYGGYTAHGGAGNDSFVLYYDGTGDVIDGGSGINRIEVIDTGTDATKSTITGIEQVYFKDQSDNYESLKLDAAQFAPGGIALDLAIDKDFSVNGEIDINLGLLTAFSAADFSFASGAYVRIQITGSAAADTITGASVGTFALDVLIGNGGNDRLYGGTGGDYIDGGAGADLMRGGAGDDYYVVDNNGDKVQEVVGGIDPGGLDNVHATVSYALTAGVENLTLAGVNSINGTGNALDNVITGNDADNALSGGVGSDTLIGGLGVDTLTGGADIDIFVFKSILDSGVGAGHRDMVTDFHVGIDKIKLSDIDANSSLAGQQHFVLDTDGIFAAGEYRMAASGGNTIIYLNADSNPGTDMQILLQNATGVTAADLIL